MPSPMRLLYISNGNIPSRWAHSMQIMKMSAAFAALTPGLRLAIPGRYTDWLRGNGSLFRWYGIRRPFPIRRIAMGWKLPPEALERPNWKAFSRAAHAYAQRVRPHILYTRAHDSASFGLADGHRVIFETHDGPGHPKTMRYIESFAEFANLVGVVTTSEVLKAAFQDAGIAPEKVLAIPGGVDLERFETKGPDRTAARRSLGLPPAPFTAVYTGSLQVHKGIGTIIDAARLCPRVQFHIIGGKQAEIDDWRQARTPPPNIRFMPFVNNEQLPRYLAAADVCLVPNATSDRTSRWTFPLKLYEYLAAHRPIIASDLPSLATALRGGELGLLIPPDDPAALAEAIGRLQHDPQLAEGLAVRGRARVEGMTWDHRARTILEHFAPELIGRAQPRA